MTLRLLGEFLPQYMDTGDDQLEYRSPMKLIGHGVLSCRHPSPSPLLCFLKVGRGTHKLRLSLPARLSYRSFSIHRSPFSVKPSPPIFASDKRSSNGVSRKEDEEGDAATEARYSELSEKPNAPDKRPDEEEEEEEEAEKIEAIQAQSEDSETPARKGFWKNFKSGFPDLGLGSGFRRSEEKKPPKQEKVLALDGGDFEIQWREIMDPTPENLLALVLTGLLGLAILQIFWQLLLVAITITLAALKYSVIAAILLALLIVLL